MGMVSTSFLDYGTGKSQRRFQFVAHSREGSIDSGPYGLAGEQTYERGVYRDAVMPRIAPV